ncbi:MAG: pyrroloquinoline quinone biosynthesis peptide chaperone PqqD [Pseudomonadales bacterium]|nr:pyrroloquinoline quinone biosynthesis peptide chaperone PqqD [Pseudomonadales bacterium]
MSLTNNQPLRFARQYKLQWETAQDAYVLLYPEGLIKLTGSAGEILKRIDGNASVLDIINSLQVAYPGIDLQQDVIEFLEHAHDKGWITVA